MSDGFSVRPDRLRAIAAIVAAAEPTAQAAQAAFDGGGAVAATHVKSMPDPTSQKALDDRIARLQKTLAEFTASLGTWTEGLRGAADFYDRTDTASAANLDQGP